MNRTAAYRAARPLTLLERLSGRRSLQPDWVPDWLIAHRKARSAFRKSRRRARRVGFFERLYVRALRVTVPSRRVLRASFRNPPIRTSVGRVRRSPSMRRTSSSGVGAEDDGEPPSPDHVARARSRCCAVGLICIRGPPLSSPYTRVSDEREGTKWT